MNGQPEIKLKPLSENKFAAFFQRIARRWLGAWYSFSEKHKKLSSLIYKFFFFVVFSLGVTIWQYIVMTFLPYAFKSLNDGAWGFPNTPVESAGGVPYVLMGDASGLGYFIAFEIAVFTAQCINFPLQRNITFKSHGNPYFQAMWYFIGWILISLFTSAVWGILNCYLIFWEAPDALIGFVKTLLTGGISFVIFFFIFLLIFPDREKQAKNARKRYEKLAKFGADKEKTERALVKCEYAEKLADEERARKDYNSADYLANAKAIAWSEADKKLEKLSDEEKINAQRELTEKLYYEAIEAAKKRDELKAAYEGE